VQVIFFPHAAWAILSDTGISGVFIFGIQETCFPDQADSDILSLAWLHRSRLSLSLKQGWVPLRVLHRMQCRDVGHQSNAHVMSSLTCFTTHVEAEGGNSDVQRSLLGLYICPTWSTRLWQAFAAAQERRSVVSFLCKGWNGSRKGW